MIYRLIDTPLVIVIVSVLNSLLVLELLMSSFNGTGYVSRAGGAQFGILLFVAVFFVSYQGSTWGMERNIARRGFSMTVEY